MGQDVEEQGHDFLRTGNADY